MTRNDLPSLLTKPYFMAEIGVDRGDFFDIYYSKKNEYYLIDLWDSNNDKYYSKKHYKESYKIIKDKTKELENIHLIKMSSFRAAKKYPDNCFDWIYIDARHGYEDVKQDIEAWLPKLKANGIISGHDYDPSPEYQKKYNFGVNEAVKEIFGEFNLTDEEYFKSWYVRL